MEKRPNRREFIRDTSAGIIGAGLLSNAVLPARYVFAAKDKVKVAVIRNRKAITGQNVCDRTQAALMIEKGLAAITGKKKQSEAWASLGITKDDVVGIKVNCNRSGFFLYTHPGLVYALCDSLSNVVNPNNIIIYERSTSEMTRAGFKDNKGNSGVRCFGANEGGGFHPKEGLTRIITDTCTKLINVPTLKAFGSEYVGSLCLKNHVGSLPRNEMPRCHGNAEFITNVCSQPSIKNKTVLALCDGLRGNYKRGVPWYWYGIIMSSDQIAVEYNAIQAINTKLVEEKEQPNSIPQYVRLAETSYGLGTCDPAKMDVSRIEM